MKIITYYLPQFHTIPENDIWWGKNHTEWDNVRKATPLFEGHNQPRVPYEEKYYNLLDIDVLRWQANLAKDYGIFGFCFYHYFFSGKLLLEKPLELFLSAREIDINFCICWANENWTKIWSGEGNKILIRQEYGTEEMWESHFDYLYKFFVDERYIRIDNKPLLVIYKPELISNVEIMMSFFNRKAKERGLEGIKLAFQGDDYNNIIDWDNSNFDYDIEYQPLLARSVIDGKKKMNEQKLYHKLKTIIKSIACKYFQYDINNVTTKLQKYNYEDIWRVIIEKKVTSSHSIPGGFCDWDNTPRRGRRGSLMLDVNIRTFKKYFTELLKKASQEYKSEYLFFFSWNEWGEGGYLEPDVKNGYSYLRSIKEALIETNEWPY